jgi:hypothetical protein
MGKPRDTVVKTYVAYYMASWCVVAYASHSQSLPLIMLCVLTPSAIMVALRVCGLYTGVSVGTIVKLNAVLLVYSTISYVCALIG